MPKGKTFKSEYHLGGAVKISFMILKETGETGILIGYYGTGSAVKFQLWDREEISDFLLSNSSYYQAEKVMDYIREQTGIKSLTL